MGKKCFNKYKHHKWTWRIRSATDKSDELLERFCDRCGLKEKKKPISKQSYLEWKPIETSPKEGDLHLIWTNNGPFVSHKKLNDFWFSRATHWAPIPPPNKK